MVGLSPPKSPHKLLCTPCCIPTPLWDFWGAGPSPQMLPQKVLPWQKRALPLSILQSHREEGNLINQSISNGRERLASLLGMLSGPSPVAIGMATVAKETASMATHPWMRAMGDVHGRTHPNPGLCFPRGVVGKGMALGGAQGVSWGRATPKSTEQLPGRRLCEQGDPDRKPRTRFPWDLGEGQGISPHPWMGCIHPSLGA